MNDKLMIITFAAAFGLPTAAHALSDERLQRPAGTDQRAASCRPAEMQQPFRQCKGRKGHLRGAGQRHGKITRNAEYDAAVERCDAYAGNAKSRFVADTRARFGMK